MALSDSDSDAVDAVADAVFDGGEQAGSHGMDAIDAVVDAGFNGGEEAGSDGGDEAGSDGGDEAGSDGRDVVDAVVGAGSDGGEEAGSDGIDAVDAVFDAGSDGGEEAGSDGMDAVDAVIYAGSDGGEEAGSDGMDAVDAVLDAGSDGGEEVGSDGMDAVNAVLDAGSDGGEEAESDGGEEAESDGGEEAESEVEDADDKPESPFFTSASAPCGEVEDADDKRESPFFTLVSSPVEMQEISDVNDIIILDGAEGVLDASFLQAFEASFPEIERRYIHEITICSVEDDDESAYSPEIVRNLCAVSHYLRIRRKRRYLNFFAASYRKSLPDFLEQDFKICGEVLNEDSPELKFLGNQTDIQIKCTGELDVAIYMTEFNKNADHFCKFWLARRDIFEKLRLRAFGRFRAIVKESGIWNPAAVEYGGPTAAP